MLRINKAKEIRNAEDLKNIIEMRLFLSKKEIELKQHFRDIMKGVEILNLGDRFIITLEKRSRIDLDKEALRQVFGDRLNEFERLTDYDILGIKESK